MADEDEPDEAGARRPEAGGRAAHAPAARAINSKGLQQEHSVRSNRTRRGGVATAAPRHHCLRPRRPPMSCLLARAPRGRLPRLPTAAAVAASLWLAAAAAAAPSTDGLADYADEDTVRLPGGSLDQAARASPSTWSMLMAALFEAPADPNNAASQPTGFAINWVNLILALMLILLMATTAVGNLFVIVAILIERNLHTIGNYLVLSLAIADLLVACLVMPLASIYQILERWTLGVLLCDIWTSADVFCCTASILHLLAIALDRYWAVTRVDYIRCQRNEKRIFAMILLVWTTASIISLAPIFGWKDAQFEARITLDNECLISQDVGYQIFATCATFYFPLTLTLLFYWKIYQVARKRIRKKLGGRAKFTPQHPSSTSSNLTVVQQQQQQIPRQTASGLQSASWKSNASACYKDSPANSNSGKQIAGKNHESIVKYLPESAANSKFTTSQIQRTITGSVAESFATTVTVMPAGTCPCPCSCHKRSDCAGGSFAGLADCGKRALNPDAGKTPAARRRQPAARPAQRQPASDLTTTARHVAADDAPEGAAGQRAARRRLDAGPSPPSSASRFSASSASSSFSGERRRLNSSGGPNELGRDLRKADLDDQPPTSPARTTDVDRAGGQRAHNTSAQRDATQCSSRAEADSGFEPPCCSPAGKHSSSDVRSSSLASCSRASSLQVAANGGEAGACGACGGGEATNERPSHAAYKKQCTSLSLAVATETGSLGDGYRGAHSPSPTKDNLLSSAKRRLSLVNCDCCACTVCGACEAGGGGDGSDSGANQVELQPRDHLAPAPASKKQQIGIKSSKFASRSSGELAASAQLNSLERCHVIEVSIDKRTGGFTNSLIEMEAAREPALRSSGSDCGHRDRSGSLAADDKMEGRGYDESYAGHAQQAAVDVLVDRDSSGRARNVIALCWRRLVLATSSQRNSPPPAQGPLRRGQSGSEALAIDQQSTSVLIGGQQQHQMLLTANSSPQALMIDEEVARVRPVPASVCEACRCPTQARPTRLDGAESAGGDEDEALPTGNFASCEVAPNQTDDTDLALAVASTANIVLTTADNMNERAVVAANQPVPPSCKAATPLRQVAASLQHQQSHNAVQSHKAQVEEVESKRERKAAKTLAIITGVFVMCWLPFFVMAIVMALLQLKPHKYLFPILLWLGYINSMLNPIIYTIFSPDFRKAFKRLLCGSDAGSNQRRRGASAQQRKGKVQVGPSSSSSVVCYPNGSRLVNWDQNQRPLLFGPHSHRAQLGERLREANPLLGRLVCQLCCCLGCAEGDVDCANLHHCNQSKFKNNQKNNLARNRVVDRAKEITKFAAQSTCSCNAAQAVTNSIPNKQTVTKQPQQQQEEV